MNDQNVKLLRKQLKNVVKEHLNKDVEDQMLDNAMHKVMDHLNSRLDNIEKFCQDQLKKMDERAKAVQSFIVREVVYDISNKLNDFRLTQEAFLLVASENGLTIEDFETKIKNKKEELKVKAQEEASLNKQEEPETQTNV